MSIKNDGHYFCRAGGNRPDGLNEPVTSASYRGVLAMPINENGESHDDICYRGRCRHGYRPT
ncbi:hypothetical protein AUD90_16255 [Salmonella enterica subsp. enterica serovar Typhimurium var. 5-]|nr:hypothetical protein [Salmonella enterica subsp. enterica serovar Typhimurium var. 5-]